MDSAVAVTGLRILPAPPPAIGPAPFIVLTPAAENTDESNELNNGTTVLTGPKLDVWAGLFGFGIKGKPPAEFPTPEMTETRGGTTDGPVIIGAVVMMPRGPVITVWMTGGKIVLAGSKPPAPPAPPIPACGNVDGVDVVFGKAEVGIAWALLLAAAAEAAATEELDRYRQYDDDDTTQVQALDT